MKYKTDITQEDVENSDFNNDIKEAFRKCWDKEGLRCFGIMAPCLLSVVSTICVLNDKPEEAAKAIGETLIAGVKASVANPKLHEMIESMKE